MSYLIETTHNATYAYEAVVGILKEQDFDGTVPVILVPTPVAVGHLRDFLALRKCAFAVRVETLAAWVEDRWELFGDGRRVVSPLERTLFVSQALEQAARVNEKGREAYQENALLLPESLSATPGIVALVSSLARDSLSLVLDAARESAVELSEGECGVIASLQLYAQILQDRGLCEVSDAARLLPGVMKSVPALMAVGFDELSVVFDTMLRTLSQRASVTIVRNEDCSSDGNGARSAELDLLLNRIFTPSQGQALTPRGALRFLLPAGSYAAPALLLQEVMAAIQSEQKKARDQGREIRPVYIASREPASLFAQLSESMVAEGVTVAVMARTTFAQTDFGRALLSLVGFACDEQYRIEQAMDFALSAFSGMSLRSAYALDARWRKDRTVNRERIAEDLSQASDLARSSLLLLAQGDIEGLIAEFDTYLRRKTNLGEAYRNEQLAAMSAARRFAQTCVAQGFSATEKLKFLEEVSVAIHTRAGAEASDETDEPVVLFMDLASVANRVPCSCSTLVLCDLLESIYPVRPIETGATLLLEKLKISPSADALVLARKQFFRALATACDTLVCERPLNTVDADKAYPAVMYEELIDCYRADPTLFEDIDKATGLPRVLLTYAVSAGEDNLHTNLTLDKEEPEVDFWEVPALGDVSPAHQGRVVLPCKSPETPDNLERPTLSPSALESYLECPQKWFALRRLRLSELDAGFGPLEMGSFSHGVLKSFYEHFKEEGYLKVTESTLVRARDLMRETFERHAAFQSELKCGNNRLIPLTPTEQTEVSNLEKKLVGYLDHECTLLPDFVPTYFEYDFGANEPFEYAGCFLRGSIDRIDVNQQGQAVIIDYKGSVSADYDLVQATPAAQAENRVVPHKIQTLVYAQVARRLLGLEVVGALYVSYGRKAKVSGAYDRGVLDESALLGVSAKNCGIPGPAGEVLGVASFSEALDNTEASIAKAIESLRAGLVSPEPRGKDPCGFCPVLTCPKRRTV